MKRATYILFILLTVVSATRLSIDRHFCGGHVVDVKLEFSDRRASCGMEQDEQVCLNYHTYDVNCCHNESTTLLVDNYVVSTILSVDTPYTNISEHLPFVTSWPLSAGFSSSHMSVPETGPPWLTATSHDRQSSLCIFRI